MNSPKESSFSVLYRYKRGGVATHEIRVEIDTQTMRSVLAPDTPQPVWAKLDFHPCEGCRWQESDQCPVAQRLAGPIADFSHVVSFETVDMEVETAERTYSKKMDMQQGISSIFGLLMATSGCPSLGAFRPMARYHLPFSSFDETFFRITGVTLMQQMFESDQPITRAGTVERLNKIYEEAAAVNAGIMERLRVGFAASADSSPNAVAILSAFSGLATLLADQKLGEVEALFKR